MNTRVMPNHIHAIVTIGRDTASCRPLGRIIQAYKSITTNRYTHGVNTLGWPRFPARLWQRNHNERIIRDDREPTNTGQYTTANPVNWPADQENPENNFGPPLVPGYNNVNASSKHPAGIATI